MEADRFFEGLDKEASLSEITDIYNDIMSNSKLLSEAAGASKEKALLDEIDSFNSQTDYVDKSTVEVGDDFVKFHVLLPGVKKTGLTNEKRK